MTPSAGQSAVRYVVLTACLVTIGGLIVMAVLAYQGKPIPDQIDRLTFGALAGGLALLGRTSDTRAEAKEAAEQMVNDLAVLADPPSATAGATTGPPGDHRTEPS